MADLATDTFERFTMVAPVCRPVRRWSAPIGVVPSAQTVDLLRPELKFYRSPALP